MKLSKAWIKPLLSLLLIISFSCEKDEVSKLHEKVGCSYSLTIETECGNFETRQTHFITKEKYNEFVDRISSRTSQSCNWIIFDDKNRKSQKGYLRYWLRVGKCG